MRHQRNFNKLPESPYGQQKPHIGQPTKKASPTRPIQGTGFNPAQSIPSDITDDLLNPQYQQDYDNHNVMQPTQPSNMHMGKPLVQLTLKQSSQGQAMAQSSTPQRSIEKFNVSQMVKIQPYDSKMNSSLTQEQQSKFKYAINFNIFYETVPGEEIYVLGSIKELGQWKEYKLKLFWTDGHIWRNKEPLLVNESYFQYKYALFGVDGELTTWEQGVDRIADLETLPSHDSHGNGISGPMKQTTGTTNTPKLIYITDIWEEYKIRFTLFDPLYEKGDQMFLSPNPASGLTTSIKMERTQHPDEWLISKYGKPIQLWECVMTLHNQNGSSEGQFMKGYNTQFSYTYFKKKATGGFQIKERKPDRLFYIDNPINYKGELSDNLISSTPHYKCKDMVKIVNGVVEKADGTFLYGFFFNEVAEQGRKHNIIIGSYPLYEVDVTKMVQNGKVTAVLNLQSDEEMAQRGLTEDQIKSWYQKHGIKSYVKFPLLDDNLDVYSENLFHACKALDHLLSKQKEKVYIHCTAGLSRSTTVVITYLTLFQKSKMWFNTNKVEDLVGQCCSGSSPNIQAVQRCRQKYNHIMMEKNKLMIEAERRRLDIIAQKEEQNLWQRREDYLRAERERNQRAREQENEQMRERRRKEEEERKRLIKLNNDREIKLMSELRNINLEEEEMIRRIKQQQIDENTVYEHFVITNNEYVGVTDAEIEEQCNVLFSKPPIKFNCRKEIKVETEIKMMIDQLNITIPIIHIKGSLYLVGIYKIHLEQKADYVIAQVGGGYQKFEPYIIKNHKSIERQLIIKMIQSKESLEWIVDALIRGEKIPTMHHTAYDSASQFNPIPVGSNQVSRIEVQRVPSQRLDKNGFYRADQSPTRRTTMVASSASPSRTGLSPTRLDTYKSPSKFTHRISSPLSKSSRNTGSTKERMESPSRRTKTGYSSPKGKSSVDGTAFTPTVQTKKLIKQIEAKYEPKRQAIMKQLGVVEHNKNEHYQAQDQTHVEYNKGKYAYIHTNGPAASR